MGRTPRTLDLAVSMLAGNIHTLPILCAFLKVSNHACVSVPERSLPTRALRMAMVRVRLKPQTSAVQGGIEIGTTPSHGTCQDYPLDEVGRNPTTVAGAPRLRPWICLL